MITIDLHEVVDHLAWLERCLFRDDFKTAFVDLALKNDWDSDFAKFMADKLWDSLGNKGIVATYQEYIADKHICMLILEVVNISK